MGCFTYLIADFAQTHKCLNSLHSDEFCHADQYNKDRNVYYIFKVSQVEVSKCRFLSLKIVLILAISPDPDEIWVFTVC